MDWDVFISHAWEDKEPFARPLAEALEREGVRVWFDELTLYVGDSLRRSIDCGLANSRYGVVILSPNFFAKEWPQKELDGLAAREVSGEKVILPVWHNITADQIRKYSPNLADRIAVKSEHGLEHVVKELLRVIKPTPELKEVHAEWDWLPNSAKQAISANVRASASLARQLSESPDEAALDSVAIDILKKIADENRGCTPEWLADTFNMSVQKMQYHLDNLRAREFLGRPFLSSLGTEYRISSKGRKFLFEKDLL